MGLHSQGRSAVLDLERLRPDGAPAPDAHGLGEPTPELPRAPAVSGVLSPAAGFDPKGLVPPSGRALLPGSPLGRLPAPVALIVAPRLPAPAAPIAPPDGVDPVPLSCAIAMPGRVSERRTATDSLRENMECCPGCSGHGGKLCRAPKRTSGSHERSIRGG